MRSATGRTSCDLTPAMAAPSDTFDWLLSLRTHPQLRAWLLPSAHGLALDARVLVVGCGDSTLSEDLWDSGFTRVVGVDVEERCIVAARARTVAKPGLEWVASDLAAKEGLPPALGTFDLALDKGTLDAIVCAGDDVACRAVWNVCGALAPGGTIVVVTLHCDGKVQRFLEAPALGFASVSAHPLNVPPVFNGKVVVCRLGPDSPSATRGAAAADEAFETYRAQVAVAPYEDATQLLTPEREASLRLLFAMRAQSLNGGVADAPAVTPGVGRLGLADAYDLIFTQAEKSEYEFKDFVQDVTAFDATLASDGAYWNAESAIRFLRAMQ